MAGRRSRARAGNRRALPVAMVLQVTRTRLRPTAWTVRRDEPASDPRCNADPMWNISLDEISYLEDRNLIFHLSNWSWITGGGGRADPRCAATRAAAGARAASSSTGSRHRTRPLARRMASAPRRQMGSSTSRNHHMHTLADAVPTRWSSYPTATRGVFH